MTVTRCGSSLLLDTRVSHFPFCLLAAVSVSLSQDCWLFLLSWGDQSLQCRLVIFSWHLCTSRLPLSSERTVPTLHHEICSQVSQRPQVNMATVETTAFPCSTRCKVRNLSVSPDSPHIPSIITKSLQYLLGPSRCLSSTSTFIQAVPALSWATTVASLVDLSHPILSNLFPDPVSRVQPDFLYKT